MKTHIGRTGRRRKRRKLEILKCGLFETEENLNNLLNWMGQNGFKPTKKLKPKYFIDSGRGLMTQENILSGNLVISVPEKLLITPKKVLNSSICNYFERYSPKATGHQILSVFLMCEQAKSNASKWYPYISTLPQVYDIPAYSNFYAAVKLPNSLSFLVAKQIESVKESYNNLKLLFKALELTSPLYHGAFNFDLYKWAWCTVNTRCVYIDCLLKNCIGKACTYHLALVPYLDLLNHSSEVQVQAGYNCTTKEYQIRTLCPFKKYSQVFINYGPHGNQKLLTEYGFIMIGNCNDSIPIFIDDIISACKFCQFVTPAFSSKLEFILQNNLTNNINCSSDGLSWNLKIILKILLSQYPVKWWKSRLSNCTHLLNDDEHKYVILKNKLLQLKLDEYKSEYIESIKSQEKCSYLFKVIHQLFLIEKSFLIKAME